VVLKCISFFFKSQLFHTITESNTVIILFYILNLKTAFNASDLIFSGGKYHVFPFLEQGILSEMFYFNYWHNVAYAI
jgi:hypothetical protein